MIVLSSKDALNVRDWLSAQFRYGDAFLAGRADALVRAGRLVPLKPARGPAAVQGDRPTVLPKQGYVALAISYRGGVRVLVIGGTGFIGPWVVRGFCDAGCEVTVFHRGEHNTQLPPEVREVLHPSAGMPVVDFPTEVAQIRPEIVVHMIAMGQADAHAAVRAFAGSAQRFVVLSSGDVYRAYGKFTCLEAGPVEKGLLTEESPLRSTLYPYRAQAKSSHDLAYYYEKILVEDEFLRRTYVPATVLRLPKVYGPGGNSDLRTVHTYRNHSNWRWTHGYVENVAAAIVLAALHPQAAGRVYNTGEAYTPTVGERLAALPASSIEPVEDQAHNFEQDIAYDTTRIRRELSYMEPIAYAEGIRRTLAASSPS